MTKTTRESILMGFLRDYPAELTVGGEDPEAVLDRYFAPGFEFRSDGLAIGRRQIVESVSGVAPCCSRDAAAVESDVHEVLVEGDRFAARFTLRMAMGGGGARSVETYAFGELAGDGRVRRVEQITRTVREA